MLGSIAGASKAVTAGAQGQTLAGLGNQQCPGHCRRRTAVSGLATKTRPGDPAGAVQHGGAVHGCGSVGAGRGPKGCRIVPCNNAQAGIANGALAEAATKGKLPSPP